MADTKITALTAITTVDPAADVLPIVDVSDTSMAASGTTKKITSNQILGAGGTATLASATITGDLTVDTSTLKVDSANNRVGIGTASPITGSSLDVRGAVGTGTDVQSLTLIDTSALAINNGGGLSFGYVFQSPSTVIGRAGYIKTIKENATDGNYASAMVFGVTANGAATTERYRIASDGVATWSNVGGVAGTAMTLNSTGLGIGAAPTQKLHVKGVVNFEQVSGGTNGWQVYTYTDGTYRMNYNGAGADELIIDTSGNVGIGVTPSAWVSYQKAIDFGGAGNYGSVSARANFAAFATNCYFDGTNWIYKNTNPANLYEQSAGANIWRTAPSGTAGTAITFTQAMTLDASGNLLVGTTTTSGNAGGLKLSNVSGNRGEITFSNNSGSADYVARFNYGSTPTLVGNITVSSGGTSFVTTSDYRLKQDVQPLVGGLARINALKPSTYKWKADDSNGEGFIAHELADVVPLAVTGEKDAVNEDGSIKPQGVDLSKVVPVLVAAIQELTAEVNALKNA